MYKLEYLKIAKLDLNEIITYINDNLKNPTAAKEFIKTFIKDANNIIKFPYSNPEYITNKKLNNKYRISSIKNFLIFYTIDEKEKTITISRVLYKKREINKFLK